MKIAFVLSHITKSTQWLWFSEELKNRGVDHYFIIIEPEIPILKTDIEAHGIKVYFLKHSSVFSHVKNILKAKTIMLNEKTSLVHTSLPYGNLVGLAAARLAGIKNRITTCENASWAHDFKNKKQERIDRFTFNNVIKTIAVADSAYEYLLEHWHLPKEKLCVIYHGLKVSEYNSIQPERIEKIKKELALPDGTFLIGMLARLELWKGQEYAIKAMAEVKKIFPNIKLCIFGSEGQDKDLIFKLIKDLSLEDTVFFKGFINDPVALFQLFDIHLHIPINKYVENCGISIIEGMISSRPQILTLSGYAFQSAKHMENAYVVNYCDAHAVKQAIIELYNNKALREKLAANAYTTAIRDYSNDTKVTKHIQLYKQINEYFKK